MTWQTMYPANPGSPYTTLASGIDDDDTSISLTADPGFAAATNLACIWDDTGNFEVVKYTDLTGTTLTVERAFEGTAQAWSAGAYIANLVPAYAINSLQNNVDDLNTNKAGSTSAALTILVYDGTPTESDLSAYDEIYTTPALCFAALPAIINHAVTITMRKADGSAYAAATLQRVVAGGSITIQGEYYYNNTVASAGSGAGKFNVVSAHSGLIQAGDRVLLIQYSGTVGSSTPSNAFVDTVASVDGTEITLTTRTSDTFTTSWRYIILRTVTGQIIVESTDQVTVKGLNVVSSSYFQMRNSNENVLNSMIFEFSGQYGLIIRNCKSRTESNYIGVLSTYASAGWYPVWTTSFTNLDIRNMLIQSSAANGTGFGAIKADENSKVYLRYSAIKNGGSGTSNGIVASEGATVNPISVMLDGVSDTYKMAIALSAITGGQIAPSSVTFGSNITTQKSPVNWAATTDGSYIS